MNTIYPERSDIFKELKALFEFDNDGILPLLAPGMVGPIAFPLAYLDMSKITCEKQHFQGMLMLTWTKEDSARIIVNANTYREATNEEMYEALAYYKAASQTYQQEMIQQYTKKDRKIPNYLQARLGMIPYFENKNCY